jgi:hypothetical protein
MILTTKAGIVLLQLEAGSGQGKGKAAKETISLLQHAKRALGETLGQSVIDMAVVFVGLGEWRGL